MLSHVNVHQITVSDAEGGTLCQASLKQEPIEIRVSNTRFDTLFFQLVRLNSGCLNDLFV